MVEDVGGDSRCGYIYVNTYVPPIHCIKLALSKHPVTGL